MRFHLRLEKISVLVQAVLLVQLPGSTVVPDPSFSTVLLSRDRPLVKVFKNWASSSSMICFTELGSLVTSGKVSPRIVTTVSTSLLKKPGLALSFSIP
jgi:hypothetical protein